MKKIIVLFVFVLVVALSPINTSANTSTGNDYPLVFVNGLGGWGPDEMLGVKYWGGFYDLEKFMDDKGYNMILATVKLADTLKSLPPR